MWPFFCLFVFKTSIFFLQCFREFLGCCGKALDINDQLIKEDQRMYQEDLKEKYAHLKTQLAKYIGDEVCCLITIEYSERFSFHYRKAIGSASTTLQDLRKTELRATFSSNQK